MKSHMHVAKTLLRREVQSHSAKSRLTVAAIVGFVVGAGTGITLLLFEAEPHDGQFESQSIWVERNTPSNVLVPAEPAMHAPAVHAPATSTPTFATGVAKTVLNLGAPVLVIAGTIQKNLIADKDPITLRQSDFYHFVATQAIHHSNLPSEIQALHGRRVVLFDSKGNRCEATVGNFNAAVEFYEDRADLPTAAELKNIWAYSQPALVADVTSLGAGCDDTIVGALILNDDSTKRMIQQFSVQHLRVTDPLAKAVLAKAQVSSEWVTIQNRFNKERGQGLWNDEAYTSITLVGGYDKGTLMLTIRSGGCGEYEGEYVAQFHLVDGQLGNKIEIPKNLLFDSIDLAIDANGDGVPELIANDGNWGRVILWSQDGQLSIEQGLEPTINVCRC